VTATAVIEEIKQLPRAEQSRVLHFAFELARERQLSGEELAGLAQRMADANDPAEKNDCGRKSTGDFTVNNMPRIRRQNLPPRLLDNLLDCVDDRNISAAQLGLLAIWMRADPEVPEGKWFKKFPGMTVCGKGDLIKTFLQPGQVATGEELK
jgi:hypothetical protein